MALSYKFTILDRFPEIIKLINELSKLKVSSKKYETLWIENQQNLGRNLFMKFLLKQKRTVIS